MIAILLLSAAVAAAGAAFAGWVLLRASLPRQQGIVRVAGLDAAVAIERDARAAPRIRGEALDDAMAGLGYLHAQERFFQMDGQRRFAAGELAELIGPAGLVRDERMRRYRMRSVAQEVLTHLPANHRGWIDAYTRGVNAGLDDLGARPPEYLLLGCQPAPWRAEDSILVMFAMYHSLAIGLQMEKRLDVMRAALPMALVEFMTPESTRFDCPMQGDPAPYAGGGPAPIPGPEVIDLRAAQTPSPGAQAPMEDAGPLALGSNCWAVSGAHTADGRAILANDMHLELMVPSTWYHAEIDWGAGWAVGVTLPGVPGIVVGSNGQIAWGCTNLNADVEDYVVVRVDPDDPSRYLTGAGSEPFESVIERIAVRGAESRSLVIRSTRWGAITDTDATGRPLVLKWPALNPATVDLSLLDLIECRTLEGAVRAARRWQGPPQNVVIAAADGRIAWVVSGWHPSRKGIDRRFPSSWEAAGSGWEGAIPEVERPVLIDPPSGHIVSANQRAMDNRWAAARGGYWAAGERASRILDRLRTTLAIDESAMLRLQLDTRAQSLDFYRDLILETATAGGAPRSLNQAFLAAQGWNGQADCDQLGMTLIVEFRAALHSAIIRALMEPCLRLDKEARYVWFQSEEVLRRILEERPEHLLPPGHASWRAFFLDSLQRAATRARLDRGESRRAGLSWGERNRAAIRHPLSSAAAFLSSWLDMKRARLAGHTSAVRVQTPSFGASQRLVVAPGHEHEGILTLPCGQSGHFLSPNYRDAFAPWSAGARSPLKVGQVVNRIHLEPAGP